MKENAFKELICETGHLNAQKVRSIIHPALRYIQRVLVLTLFCRGETMSVFRKPELFYLYCMLRRNEGEMHFQPHFGYYLAKHFYTVATETQPNGIITVGGVITKITRALNIHIGDDIVQGATTLDIQGLVQMKLIERAENNQHWLSSDWVYKLPLTTEIDPHSTHTWRILDETAELAEQKA